jgi:hypothetical protein
MIWLKLISKAVPWQAWAALGGALLLGVAYIAGTHNGRTMGRIDALQASVDMLRERNKTDAEIQNLDDISLCVLLGGLPDDCKRL